MNNDPSRLSAGGDVNIGTGLGNLRIIASEIDAGNDINLNAPAGKVELLAAVDREFEQESRNSESALWVKASDKGSEHESVRHTILTGEGDLNITAANGVTVQYRSTGNLDSDIAQLSQAPGLAWMAELKDDPNVNWQAIEEVHREWSETHEGLGGPAAAVIALAIAIATQQYQLGAALLEGTALATSATATAAAQAGISALASQAGVSLISNKGDLSAVFKEMASADTVRSLAASMLTAGLLDAAGVSNMDLSKDFFAKAEVLANLQDQLLAAGIRSGVDSVITGADLSDSLKTNLRFAGAAVLGAQLSQEIGEAFREGEIDRGIQLIAHAATGCAAGAIGTGNCGAGAAGQLAGEISAIVYGDALLGSEQEIAEDWYERGIDIARVSGALASALAGGSAEDINLGSDLGGTAAANNGLLGALMLLLRGGTKLLAKNADDAAKAAARNSSKLAKKINIDEKQLQRKFKHAEDFGINENYSKQSAEKFKNAIIDHVKNTKSIKGTYRKNQEVFHNYDAKTGINVIRDRSGNYITSFKPSSKQVEHLLKSGNLGGG